MAIRGLWKLPDGRDWLWGNLGLALMCWAMLSKPLIQLSVDGWGCVPSQLFGLRPEHCRGKSSKASLPRKDLGQHRCTQSPGPAADTVDPRLHWRLLDTHGQVWLSLLWGHCSFLLGPVAHELLFVPPKSVSLVLWKFCNQIPLASKVKFSGGSQSLCQIPRLGNLLWFLELS